MFDNMWRRQDNTLCTHKTHTHIYRTLHIAHCTLHSAQHTHTHTHIFCTKAHTQAHAQAFLDENPKVGPIDLGAKAKLAKASVKVRDLTAHT